MRSEEILDPTRGHCEYCEGFRTVEFHILDRRRHCKVWVRGRYEGVEVLENLFRTNLKRKIGTNDLERMVLCFRVAHLLLLGELSRAI